MCCLSSPVVSHGVSEQERSCLEAVTPRPSQISGALVVISITLNPQGEFLRVEKMMLRLTEQQPFKFLHPAYKTSAKVEIGLQHKASCRS